MLKLVCLSAFVLSLGSVGSVRAQVAEQTQEPAGKPGYSLHVQSKLVVLDVVVTDKQGKPVTGLPKDTFQVFENKLPQKIMAFEPPNLKGPTTPPTPEVHSTEELDKVEPHAPVSILVLDEVSSKFEDQAFARYALKKYLDGEGDTLNQPTMLIAAGLQRQMVLRDYTTSKKEILDALDRHFATNDWRQQSGSWSEQQFNATFASLISVAQATAGHPGHKNMVWVGRGFPSISTEDLTPEQQDGLQRIVNICTNILRDSRITLYSVDPAGISADPPAEDADGFYVDSPFGGDIGFENMVQATGGQAFHGRNDIDALIGTSVRDGETFYTIAYRPTSTSDDPKEFRSVQVIMKDRTLTATTREGYFAGSEPTPPALNDKNEVSSRTKFDIVEASEGLLVYDGVPLSITRAPENPDKFAVSFPVSAGQWTQDGDKEKCSFMMVVESFDRKGKLLHNEARVFGIVLPPRQEGGVDDRKVTLPMTASTAPPVARLRVIVRVNDNGKIGADNVFLVDRATLKDDATGLKPSKSK